VIELNPLTVLNSANFSSGTGNLDLVAEKDFEASIYYMNGKLLLLKTSTNKVLTLNPNQFISGVYIVKISFDNEIKSIKISKL